MEHFATERLIARDWTVADDESAFAIYGRDEVARWLGGPPRKPVASVAEMRQRLERIIERNSARPAFGSWPLELRDSGLVVGAVLLVPLPGDSGEASCGGEASGGEASGGEASDVEVGDVEVGDVEVGDVEVGWHLNPDHWGRGYATEAGRGALDLALGAYGLDEVRAVVLPGNLASLAVCRRLGMRHEGQTDRYYGVTLELFSIGRNTDQDEHGPPRNLSLLTARPG
jgi:RimJ/RimL family protein N-acetyltransferase